MIGAAAVLITFIGVNLWLTLLVGPLDLVTGLLDARRFLDAAEKHLSKTDLKRAGYEVLAAQAAVDRARQSFTGRAPLLDVAAAIPTVSRALGEVPHLIEAADLSAQAAIGTQRVAQTALRGPNKIIERTGDEATIRIDRVEALGQIIADVKDKIDASRAELEAVDVGNLPRRARPAIARGISRANKTSELLADAVAGFDILPGVLGADGPRTYLLAMQNPSELRGTGGSILRFALLSIDEGKPELLSSQSIYRIDVGRQTFDIPLPADAWLVAAIEDAQRAGNANWSPDWPLSAELTIAYAEASDAAKQNVDLPPIDGVMSLDPIVMKNLIPGVGPITTETERRITERRVLRYLLYDAYGAYPNPGTRRAVLKQLIESFYDNLIHPNRPTELLPGFGASLAHKHMQIWLRDPDEERYMKRMNWDGAIVQAKTGDYLSIVQENVGGNKLNYFESQRHEVDVTIAGSDAQVATTVRIHNGLFAPQPRYVVGDSGDDGDGFFHQPMVNVYVPERAVLQSAEVLEGELFPAPPPAIWNGSTPATHLELGKLVWTGTLRIHAQEDGALRYAYLVPGVVEEVDGRKVYRLTVQHQPKLHPETLSIHLSLPEGAQTIEAPGWNRDQDGSLLWERAVDADIVLEVSWQE